MNSPPCHTIIRIRRREEIRNHHHSTKWRVVSLKRPESNEESIKKLSDNYGEISEMPEGSSNYFYWVSPGLFFSNKYNVHTQIAEIQVILFSILCSLRNF